MFRKIILSLSIVFAFTLYINAQEEKKAEAVSATSNDTKKAESAAPAESKAATTDDKAVSAPDDGAVPFHHTVWNKIVWYIPNRCLDIDDIVSTTIGVGPEISLYFRTTNYLQFGGAYGEKYYLAKNYHRQYGGGYYDGWNFGFLCLSKDYGYVDHSFGSLKNYVYEHKNFGIPSFNNDVYKDHIIDFWAIEAKVGWLVNVGVAVHPVEIVDCILGIFLLDSMKDDEDGSWKDLRR